MSGGTPKNRLGLAPWATVLSSVALPLILVSGGAPQARAEDGSFTPSYNDYGTTGLIQMPNGRMADDGAFALGFSKVSPYTRMFMTMQFLPWLQGTFRYTDISYASYGITDSQSYKDKSVDVKIRLFKEGPSNPEVSIGLRDIGGTGIFSSEYIAASRRYYGFDFTGGVAWGNMGSRGQVSNPIGLLFESYKTREAKSDSTGTLSNHFFKGKNIGLFGGVEWDTPLPGVRLKVEYDSNDYQSEYNNEALEVNSPINVAVGYHPFSWLDLAIGYERGNTVMFRGMLTSNFNQDMGVPKLDEVAPLPLTSLTTSGGASGSAHSTAAARTASASLDKVSGDFIQTSVDGLYDSFARLGLKTQSIDLVAPTVTVTLEKGSSTNPKSLSEAGLAVAEMPILNNVERVVFVHADGTVVGDFDSQKLLRQQSVQGHVIPAGFPEDTSSQTQDEIAKRVFNALKYYGFKGYKFHTNGHRAIVVFEQSLYRNIAKAFGRVARAVVLATPASVKDIEIIETNAGIPVAHAVFHRKPMIAAATGSSSVDELWQSSEQLPATTPDVAGWSYNPGAYPRFSWGLSPKLRQSIGGPNNFYLYQIYAQASAKLDLAPGLRLGGAIAQNLTNNYDNFTYDAPSKLYRVRTDIRSYLITSDTWIDNLYVNYMTPLAPDLYGRMTAGLFELMYGGVDGEILYRPTGKRWAIGLDVNHVWQRDFKGMLGFKDYDVTTGHLTWYQKLPFYGMEGSLSVGRYLAKDIGATLTLSRRFDNGMRVGAWATKTDISAETFGEGSFDKGFFVSIPFDLFSTSPTTASGAIGFRPLTRDGGAKVSLPVDLYTITGSGGGGLDNSWRDTLK